MKVIVTGRQNSGKSEFINIINSISAELTIPTINFYEAPIQDFIYEYSANQLIILIDTPAILCIKRSISVLPLKDYQKQDILIEYVKELPNCIIIKNDLGIDDFKVKIKKIVKNI